MKRILVLPDIHLEAEDKHSLQAVYKYASDHKWDEIIQLGDLLDWQYISDYTTQQDTHGKRIDKTFEYGRRWLDGVKDWAGKARLVVLEGNHDERIERYMSKHPETQGLLSYERQFEFKRRGILWVRSWSQGKTHRVGKALTHHGIFVNEHHPKAHVTKFGKTIFYGHTHDVSSYSWTRMGDNETTVGQSCGCLCKYRQYYMKGRPNRWQQAFVVIYLLPNGFFNYYVVRIFNHRFVSPEGKEYRG